MRQSARELLGIGPAAKEVHADATIYRCETNEMAIVKYQSQKFANLCRKQNT